MKRILSRFMIYVCCIACIFGCSLCIASGQSYSNDCYSGETTSKEQLSTATNIFRATYTGKYSIHESKVLLEFKPVEQLFGDIGKDNCWVWVCNVASETSANWVDLKETEITYFVNGFGELCYEKNKDYLIVAQKRVSVYYPQDIYWQIGSYCFPMEDLRTPVSNIINEHETVMDILWEYWDPEFSNPSIEADVYKTFSEYVVSLINANENWKEYVGKDHIRSNDFEEIAANSDLVVRIRVGEKEHKGEDTIEYKCKVLETVKGNIDEKEVKIRFLYNTVKRGGEYIVCLNSDKEANTYLISAKNAVQTVQEEFSVMPMVVISALGVLIVVIIGLAIIKRRRTAKSS